MKAFKKPRIAALVAVLASILVLGAGYFLLIGPRKGAVSKKQKEVEAVQQKVQAEKVAYRELLNIKNRSAEYEQKLAYLQSIIPKEPELPGLIRSIQAVADPGGGAGVPWLAFSPSDVTAPEAGAGYFVYTFSMRVGGFYDEIVDLLYRMERMPRAVVVDTVSITPTTGFLQRTFHSNLGVVQAEIQAKTFTFAQPAGSQAPAPAPAPAPSGQSTEE